jgi:hypothetical protein
MNIDDKKEIVEELIRTRKETSGKEGKKKTRNPTKEQKAKKELKRDTK